MNSNYNINQKTFANSLIYCSCIISGGLILKTNITAMNNLILFHIKTKHSYENKNISDKKINEMISYYKNINLILNIIGTSTLVYVLYRY
jgi:hypothetical protein